ncbi:MAG: glycosyltransferase [Paludibacteraceae bacterium]|nr:glycosyltransferase [Paludibacteraceae bacterium]
MIKFSFLVALYNGEQFLISLLNSLVSQDIKIDEYEIVCLDDCSPDHSSKIVMEYQKKYPNIRLYKNERNCRIATNINKLTQLAHGKYFWILGQDDYIEPYCLNKLWNKLEADFLDVLIFNYRRVDQMGKNVAEYYEVESTSKMRGVEWIKNQYTYRDRDYCNYILGYEWRAIFRTQHWLDNKIRCVEGLSWEDTVIMMKAIVYSHSVASISDILYNYRINEGSISYSNNHLKRGDYIFEFSFQVGDEVERFYNELLTLAPDLATQMYKQVKWRYNCFAFDLVRTSREQKQQFYRYYKKYKLLVLQKKYWLNWKSKLLVSYIGYWVSVICESIYKLKKRILK